jgi:TonB family protein
MIRIFRTICVLAFVAGSPAAGQSLLEGPPPFANCGAVDAMFTPLDEILETGRLAAAAGALLERGAWVTLAAGWDSTGAPDSVAVAQTNTSDSTAREAARVLRLHMKPALPRFVVRREPGQPSRSVPAPRHLLVRVDAGTPALVRAGPPEECPPELERRSGVGLELGRLLREASRETRAALPRRAVMRLRVDAAGRVVERGFEERTGSPALDEIALAASRRMRFRPAYLNRTPVPVWVVVPLEMRVSP